MEEMLERLQIEVLEEKKGFGRFAIGPLQRGFGYTIGNSLRRVLLESLEGAAITSVSIAGVPHQFTTIPGVKEDVVELLLNLKKVRLRLLDADEAKLTLSVQGRGEVKAGDFELPAGVKIANPSLHIATISGEKTKLQMEMVARRGRGYIMANQQERSKVGEILLDAIFSPVLRVGVKVEPTRVGRRTDLDRLILEITTDQTITPRQALREAAKILVSYFQALYKPRPKAKKEEKEEGIPPAVSRMLVEELDLPVRVANTLRKAKLGTVGALAKATRKDLLKVKNIGEKSVKLIEGKLKKLGVTLGGE